MPKSSSHKSSSKEKSSSSSSKHHSSSKHKSSSSSGATSSKHHKSSSGHGNGSSSGHHGSSSSKHGHHSSSSKHGHHSSSKHATNGEQHSGHGEPASQPSPRGPSNNNTSSSSTPPIAPPPSKSSSNNNNNNTSSSSSNNNNNNNTSSTSSNNNGSGGGGSRDRSGGLSGSFRSSLAGLVIDEAKLENIKVEPEHKKPKGLALWAKVRDKATIVSHAAVVKMAHEKQQKHKANEQALHTWEDRLMKEVDEDLFEEPRKFNTLPRVIDVLGIQMIDDATVQEATANLPSNPAYRHLKAQQKVVEDAIEHMAVVHCADLNASVISVGRMARQFSEAVDKVRGLRKQVRDIQDSLGPSQASHGDPRAAAAPGASGGNAAAMSLRELWLKKLECEATLALLEKLDIIRAASARCDQYLAQSRIGAATLTVSLALDTMFRDDVAQVQALHKIMEQLMMRKQVAEEIVWDTLTDVVFLRTGNGLKHNHGAVNAGQAGNAGAGDDSGSHKANSGAGDQSVGSSSGNTGNAAGGPGGKKKLKGSSRSSGPRFLMSNGMINPFATQNMQFAQDDDDDDEDDNASVQSDHSCASMFSIEGDDLYGTGNLVGVGTASGSNKTATTAAASDDASVTSKGSQPAVAASKLSTAVQNSNANKRVMIPISMIEAELDLEADERRLQEEVALSGMPVSKKSVLHHHNNNHSRATSTSMTARLPRYANHVWAERILVECLASLKRLDDVERNIAESLAKEIRQLVQREQARTFSLLERKQVSQSIRAHGKSDHLKDFRRHLTGLLSAFGCVLLRLKHLAQILRFRISSDRELLHKMGNPSTVMRAVLTDAYTMMQREIKAFLQACLRKTEIDDREPIENPTVRNSAAYERGLFSLGIVDAETQEKESKLLATATRSNVMEMSTTRFVSSVLFSKTKNTPQPRHALTFRRMVARWSAQVDAMNLELARLSGEDSSSPTFRTKYEEDALSFLDSVIQRQLLPAMQEDAVNGTIQGLERRDGFDPMLDRALYSQPNSNEPHDVDMCIACQCAYNSTGPLFFALHRLPRAGQMYQPVVAVLEHVMLTFISRIKQQMAKICEGKTAQKLLDNGDGKPATLSNVMERRRPFTRLIHAYSDGDMLEAAAATAESKQNGNSAALAPPTTDTAPRNEEKTETFNEEVAEGVDGEEQIMEHELVFLRAYFEFSNDAKLAEIKVCSDEEMMKAATLAHSLLKVASLLESRIKIRSTSGFNKPLPSTRALRESIRTVMLSGLKMAKFCRLDMLFQNATRLAKVCKSSTLVARDAVRIPSSVNDLGEYLTGASDNLREAAGNAVTGYALSSLEQFIPYCLMQTVRVIAEGKGIIVKAPLTMNGIEALDRSGSVLYRDLKGATSFDSSFWDVELAAISFERSASFMAMMELEMEELVAYYSANKLDFPEEDFILMFSMTGPRRTGDVGRFHMLKRRGKK